MKDYSYLDDSLLSATRSLPFYYDFYLFFRKYSYSLDPSDITSFRVKSLLYLPQHLIEFSEQFFSIVSIFGLYNFMDSCKAVHSAYMRTSRYKSRVYKMFDYFDSLYFVTLTFNDNYINQSYDHLHSLAVSFCKMTSSLYIVNSDFGDKLGRLHFHAVLSLDICSSCQDLWYYGFVKVQSISNTDIDKRRLSRYCTKLARHATKNTTFKISYSRFGKVRKKSENP